MEKYADVLQKNPPNSKSSQIPPPTKILTSFSTTDEIDDANIDTEARQASNPDKDAEIAKHTILGELKVYLHKKPKANLKTINIEPGYHHANYHVTDGYGNEKEWIYENRHISLLLESLDWNTEVPNSGFVCHSGLLVELGLIGYNIHSDAKKIDRKKYLNREKTGMKFVVQKVGKVFYMCELQTEETKPRDDNEKESGRTPAKKGQALTEGGQEPTETCHRPSGSDQLGATGRMKFPGLESVIMPEDPDEIPKKEYAGRRLESYITTAGQTSTSDKHLNPNLEYNVVFQAMLQSHKLTYKSEIDACLQEGDVKFIEIKAASNWYAANEKITGLHEYKQLRWWLQTYLAHISDIVVGDLVRGENGLDKNEFYTRKLYRTRVPEITKEVQNTETKNATFKYISKVLGQVIREVNTDLQAFVFTREKGQHDFQSRIDHASKFLPHWFVKKYNAVETNVTPEPQTQTSTSTATPTPKHQTPNPIKSNKTFPSTMKPGSKFLPCWFVQKIATQKADVTPRSRIQGNKMRMIP